MYTCFNAQACRGTTNVSQYQHNQDYSVLRY